MYPSRVYLYDQTGGGYSFFIGSCSVATGLSFLPPSLGIQITDFGATCLRDYGWATSLELPEIRTVEDATSFFEREGDIGIIEFGADLKSWGTLSNHDDQECHFVLAEKRRCVSLMNLVIPQAYGGQLVSSLLNKPGVYMDVSTGGSIRKYSSFDDYLRKRDG